MRTLRFDKPRRAPILKALEFDPVWFWLLFLLNITLGAITPPFGYVMFAVKAAAEDVGEEQKSDDGSVSTKTSQSEQQIEDSLKNNEQMSFPFG